LLLAHHKNNDSFRGIHADFPLFLLLVKYFDLGTLTENTGVAPNAFDFGAPHTIILVR